MARRRRRKEREPSILDVALEQPWHVSATLAGIGLIVTTVFLPATFGSSKFLAPMTGMLQAVGWLFTGLFALIAVIKYLHMRALPRPSTYSLMEPTAVRESGPSSEPKKSWAADLDAAWGATLASYRPPQTPVPPGEWSLELLRQIEWKRFEELVAAYLREAGYRVETIRCGADGGVDAKVYKGDDLIAIAQCKAWNSRPVGVKPVRELLGVMAHQKVPAGLFFATGDFTSEAVAFGQDAPLTLVSGEELMKNIGALSVGIQERLLAVATVGEYRTPTCPSCGIKMVDREGGGKHFWGCRNYPRCRQTFPITGA